MSLEHPLRLRGGSPMTKHDFDSEEKPPDWETITPPPNHILAHLTDAHCHPTDLDQAATTYAEVPLGGIASMATIPEDQSKVSALASQRGWERSTDPSPGGSPYAHAEGSSRIGARSVACFGYHPWFSHRYTLQTPTPSKQSHYTDIFFPSHQSSPSVKHTQLLSSLIPYLPEPIPFQGLLGQLRDDIQRNLDEGRLTMLGEVGLDGGARVRWPWVGRGLHPDFACRLVAEDLKEGNEDGEEEGMVISEVDDDGQEVTSGNAAEKEENESRKEGDWNRLTPFKVSMIHQKEIVLAQMEIAVELGVNVSFHSVAAAGPTMDVVNAMKKKHGKRFMDRVNVDLHSCGGWSPQSWTQAERQFPNLYTSPSLLLTPRTLTAPQLIRSISPSRLLVESDTHNVTMCARYVWAAVVWIGKLRGWGVEDGSEDWKFELTYDDDAFDEKGKSKKDEGVIIDGRVWTVRTLERNWARFMRV